MRLKNTKALTAGVNAAAEMRYADASSLLEPLLGKKNPLAELYYGISIGELGDVKAGLAYIDKSIKIDSSIALSHFNRAVYLNQLGRGEEGERALVQATKLDPKLGRAWGALADAKHYKPGNPVPQRIERALKGADRENRSYMHFALGKIYQDMGEYDRAWDNYQKGNETFPANDWDVASHHNMIKNIMYMYSRKIINKLQAGRLGNKSGAIFVVGMPRSGTSLVENILAANSQIEPMGETPWIKAVIQAVDNSTPGMRYPVNQMVMVPKVMDGLSEAYLSQLNRQTDKTYFVDKHPLNFQHVGLIKTIFPDAKIIHVRRDPMDTMLSCWQQPFTSGQDYSFDRANLCNFYVEYERIMDYWHEMFPDIVTVNYEDVVSMPRSFIPAMMTGLDIKLEEEQFRPQDVKRVVRTASLHQVREPIYRSSVNRWEHYAANLADWLEMLD